MKKIIEKDRQLKSLDAFDSKDRTSDKKFNIFKMYEPMINGKTVRVRSEVSRGK
jgi:hypothetical protein